MDADAKVIKRISDSKFVLKLYVLNLSLLCHIYLFFRPNYNRIIATTKDLFVKKGDIVSYVQIGYTYKVYKIVKVRPDLTWHDIVSKLYM